MKESSFLFLLVVCSVVFLVFSFLVMAFQTWPNDARDLQKYNDSIKNIDNGTLTQLETLISWQGQGALSWGAGFLASISVFSAILLALRRTERSYSKDSDSKAIDLFLSGLAVVFLVITIYAAFELFRYYRIVAVLQNQWQDVTKIVVPRGWQFDSVLNYWGEYSLLVISSIFTMYFSWAYLKKRKTGSSAVEKQDRQRNLEILKKES